VCAWRGLDREQFWNVRFGCVEFGCDAESLRNVCVCVGSIVAVVCSLERNSLFVCGECAGRVSFLRSFWFLGVWLCI
jgi:hypothetical protein